MRTLSKILVAVAVGALAAPALAGAAPTAKSHGIVVQRDAKAGVVVVAGKTGKLQRIKVAKPSAIAMGSVLQVIGTKVSVVGHVHRAKLRGVVVRRHRHSFALAGDGSVLAVTSPTPPAAGEQVTATVQVTPTELDDDNGDEQVNQDQVASAELRGTVVSQTATTLVLALTGFPDNLTIAVGPTTPIPVLAPQTPVKVRVALAPVAGNSAAVSLTLLSLRVDDNQNNQSNDGEHSNFVKAEGQVTGLSEATATATGLITVTGEHGAVTFVIPAGFGPSGATMGAEVDALGTAAVAPATQPTLTRLEVDGNNGDSGNGGNDDSNDGGNSGQNSSQGSGGND